MKRSTDASRRRASGSLVPIENIDLPPSADVSRTIRIGRHLSNSAVEAECVLHSSTRVQTACLSGVSHRLWKPKGRLEFIARTPIDVSVWTLPEDVRSANFDTACSANSRLLLQVIEKIVDWLAILDDFRNYLIGAA